MSETGVDADMEIDLAFADGVIGRVRTSMKSPTQYIYATITGEDGVLEVENPFIPMKGNSLTVRRGSDVRVENLTTEPSYLFQLRAVTDVLLRGAPILTNQADSIGNMDVIDAAYRAAGMQPHQPAS